MHSITNLAVADQIMAPNFIADKSPEKAEHEKQVSIPNS
jgi:hypothetical protein